MMTVTVTLCNIIVLVYGKYLYIIIGHVATYVHTHFLRVVKIRLIMSVLMYASYDYVHTYITFARWN